MINRSCDEGSVDTPTLPRTLYGTLYEADLSWRVPSRRLDDRIRELCYQVISAGEGELEPLIEDLKSALHEHNSRLRKLAASKLTNSFPPRKEPTL